MGDDGVKLVSVPWADGTVRELPVGSVVEFGSGPVYVDDGGYQFDSADVGDGCSIKWHEPYAHAAFMPADPPLAKGVELPTKPGAVILVESAGVYARVGRRWVGVGTGLSFADEIVAEWARSGVEVLFDGVSL